jgi:O-Antigen ligase
MIKIKIDKPSKIFYTVVKEYAKAKNNGYIPFYIVYFITVYSPFEDLFIKFIPVPSIGALIRFVPEITLYILFSKIVLSRVFSGQGIRKTPIDPLIIVFFIGTIISVFVNRPSIVESLSTLRSIWRYLSIYYIVVNLDISVEQLSRILTGIKIAGTIQGFISFIQYFLPASINQTLFAPRSVEIGGYEKVSKAESGALKVGASFGTFDTAAVLSAFLLVAIAIVFPLAYAKSSHIIPLFRDWPSILLLELGVFATKKRGALVLAVVIPIFTLYFFKRKKQARWLVYLYSIIAVIIVVLSIVLSVDTSFAGREAREEEIGILSYFLQIFSSEYWSDSSSSSRGWFVKTAVISVLKSGSWFGFGPDLDAARHSIAALLTNSGEQVRIMQYDAVEDMYWAAILVYFGVVGLIVYLLILLRLYQVSNVLVRVASVKEYKYLGAIFCNLIIVSFLYSCVERIFKLRSFSLYFWLLAGLVVNSYYAERKTRASLVGKDPNPEIKEPKKMID